MPYGSRPLPAAVNGPQVGPAQAQLRPDPVPPGVLITVDGYYSQFLLTTADGTNPPKVTLPQQAPAGKVYMIDRLATYCPDTSPGNPIVVAYEGQNITDGIWFGEGTRVAAGFLPAIVIAQQSNLTLAWLQDAGTISAGVQCLARVQYRLCTLHLGGLLQ